jgi:hypothetical protein
MTRARRSTSDESRQDADIGQTIVVIRRRTPPSTGIQVGGSLADRPRNRTRPAKSRTTMPSNPCLPDVASCLRRLRTEAKRREGSRDRRGSFRPVSRGFGGRGFAGCLQRQPDTFAGRLQARCSPYPKARYTASTNVTAVCGRACPSSARKAGRSSAPAICSGRKEGLRRTPGSSTITFVVRALQMTTLVVGRSPVLIAWT